MMYLLHEAPPEEQNFAMIMEMLGSVQVKEDDEEYESPLGIYRGAERGSKAGNGCPCTKRSDTVYFYPETSVVRMMEIHRRYE